MHSFHTECVERYIYIAGNKTADPPLTLETLPCPQCRITPAGARELEQSLSSGPGNDTHVDAESGPRYLAETAMHEPVEEVAGLTARSLAGRLWGTPWISIFDD